MVTPPYTNVLRLASSANTSATSTTAASSSLLATPDGKSFPQRSTKIRDNRGSTGIQHSDPSSTVEDVFLHKGDDSAGDKTQLALDRVKLWFNGLRRGDELSSDVERSIPLDTASHASPYPAPRRFAEAAVQTDDLPSVKLVSSPVLVPTEPNTPAGSVRGPPAYIMQAPVVRTVPNSPIATHNDALPADDEQTELSEVALSRMASDAPETFLAPTADDAHAGQTERIVTVPLSAIHPDYYKNDSVHDIVSNNGITYQILGMIGEGSYGRVFQSFTSDGRSVALKTVHKRKCYRYYGQQEALMAERDCMAFAAERGLPFWTSLIAAWEDEHNFYMAMVSAGCLWLSMAGCLSSIVGSVHGLASRPHTQG